jgi:hypothetical protein
MIDTKVKEGHCLRCGALDDIARLVAERDRFRELYIKAIEGRDRALRRMDCILPSQGKG